MISVQRHDIQNRQLGLFCVYVRTLLNKQLEDAQLPSQRRTVQRRLPVVGHGVHGYIVTEQQLHQLLVAIRCCEIQRRASIGVDRLETGVPLRLRDFPESPNIPLCRQGVNALGEHPYDEADKKYDRD